MNFRFTLLNDEPQVSDLIDFVYKQDLGYPNYNLWVERLPTQFASQYKKAILAYSDQTLVGDFIFQPHRLNFYFDGS